jgi:hypothetical protein
VGVQRPHFGRSGCRPTAGHVRCRARITRSGAACCGYRPGQVGGYEKVLRACLPSLGRPRCVTGLGSRGVAGRRAARDRLGCDVIRGLCVRAFRGSVGLGVPGKQGRDDEGAFGHMVRDLELQVHGSDLGGREDLRAVVEVA